MYMCGQEEGRAERARRVGVEDHFCLAKHLKEKIGDFHLGTSQGTQLRSSVRWVAASSRSVAAPNKVLVPTRLIAAAFPRRYTRAAQHQR